MSGCKDINKGFYTINVRGGPVAIQK
jgi:hypothetical protein